MRRPKGLFIIRCVFVSFSTILTLCICFYSNLILKEFIFSDISFRRLRVISSSLVVGELNVSQKWLELVSSGNYSMLTYEDGEIKWVTTDAEGNSLRIEEKHLGDYIVGLNEWRKVRFGVKQYEGCDLCGVTNDNIWRDIGVLTLDSGRRWKMVGNLLPWEKQGTFLFLPMLDEHQNQILTEDNVRDAIEIMSKSKNLYMFFNGWGAGASQNHIHIQGGYHSADLPIEKLETETVAIVGDVAINQFKDYPARGLVIRGDNKTSLSDVVFKLVDGFQTKNILIDIIFVNNDVVILPRAIDVPQDVTIKFGAPEMAGKFIFSNPEDYDAMTEDGIDFMLDKISLPWTGISQVLEELGLI